MKEYNEIKQEALSEMWWPMAAYMRTTLGGEAHFEMSMLAVFLGGAIALLVILVHLIFLSLFVVYAMFMIVSGHIYFKKVKIKCDEEITKLVQELTED